MSTVSINESESLLKSKLKEVFGYNQFRGNQEQVIKSVLADRNVFVIMPTGAGKSLCYQLPAVIKEGTAIVISPLIALMKNQVDSLNMLGINAQFLNSTLSKTDIARVKRDTIDGKIKLLYVAPESLTKDENIAFLKDAKISFFAIDEAHCISEWGHDFRPEYRRIRSIIDRIGNLPIIALTATATPKVQLDIQKNLYLEESQLFISSFNRKNLFYEVRQKSKTKDGEGSKLSTRDNKQKGKSKDVDKQLIEFIKQHKGKSGIVYCLSRKKVEEIADYLNVNDIKALPYHAGLDAQVRVNNQDAFLNEDAEVIVATIAFGMGIDKPDVRFVIHYDAPKSIEGYYQETGRAGRDGLEGHCLMFYTYADITKLEKFNKDKPVTERDNAKHLLQEMAAYSESSVCRRLQLLHYFGEPFDAQDCGNMCDNCRRSTAKFEGKKFIELVLTAFEETEERFETTHIINVLRGVESDFVRSYEHTNLEAFGKGEQQTEVFWNSVIRQAMLKGFLEKDIDKTDVLKITELGFKFLDSPTSVELQEDRDYETENNEAKEEVLNSRSYDEVLFDLLKKLRKTIAKQKSLPPFVIFQDPSLEEMATTYPTTESELAQVNGVGMGKIKKFGKPFLEKIKAYVKENDITTASNVVVKQNANKSKVKIFIIQQIDLRVDLEEIANAKNLTMEELISEIEHISDSGTKLNLDYYIDRIMDSERQEELYNYFMEAETDDIEEALVEFENEYTEEDIRLIRIKFMSEYAM
ncbi:MAG: DNA helicase RecQ [Cytophagales bacterium]|nr:MAG: DNA helicase RecQ [Cytophagales bacterium]TAF61880.1 MAG: DNA helicase RecQ [Cytophagales bacterium]